MREIVLFVEDYGHATVIRAILDRLRGEYGLEIVVRERSVHGGHPRVEAEFRSFIRELTRGKARLPDLLIAATDANCEGFRERKKHMQQAAEAISDRVVYAIPDPHVERWLLLDSAAFKKVLGVGCQAPDQKCDRGRYKQLLTKAVLAAGQTPLLGGLEHAADLVSEFHLEQIAKQDESFGDLLGRLHAFFRQWRSS